ncbi:MULTISPECIES: nitric oxide synthase oxygenase [unclassified Rhodococcus (in: high G+C Gram-positive bacteria)]|uniref:nitric oxide synthase oxygenase n=1 Tax=unclassified Rhodococcus (in: high G+C Gram-positive bacteria) TaxID=192944 RepID=UPI00207866B8|nr:MULTISPECIES: nitric oxide synthase oxygenase [unclassified Rhodococcus (in: high G+C Gram-positive bacteria)]
MEECSDFFRQPELAHLPDSRLDEALRSLAATGRYEQTREEIEIGAQLAWRNHARCVGRKHWRTLKLLDARHATTADEIAEACWEHLRVATNGGALRSVITVGPLPLPDGREYKILSPQLIRYAGYRHADGTVTGDPAHLGITETVTRMGWRGAGTRFDVLPLLISTPDEPLRWYDVPPDLVLEVEIEHPDHRWFADLGLRWHAVPAVSNMSFSVGGLIYPLAPFSGWYVSTEVGARNFSDEDRYDMLPAIAEKLCLDTSSERTLWRDRALVELNRAVIHSYRQAGVHMVDHHTVAKQFISHVEREESLGRTCPTDWSWINPPMSAALTPTFHRLYDAPDMDIRPNFLAAPAASGCPISGAGHSAQPR